MKLQATTVEEAGCSPERVQRVVDLCAKWVDDGLAPALMVLAARRGNVFLHEGWGITPPPYSTPVQRDTIMGIASISKTLTATAIMLLVEEGRIGLSRPVQQYLPEFEGEDKDQVWVRQILTHTSGLRDQDVEAICESEAAQWTKFDGRLSVDWAAHVPLAHSPGTQFEYSNFAYDLLGVVVERVSGQSFADFTRQRIFEPLGMKDTYFILPEALRPRALGRRPGVHPSIRWPDFDPFPYPGPPCCAHSTAMDMGIFGQTFLNGGAYGDFRLLSPATVTATTRNQIPGILRNLPNGEVAPTSGFGWFHFTEAKIAGQPSLWSPSTFCHTGASGAVLWVDPVYDIVGVFLFERYVEGVWPYDLFVNAVTACVVDG